MAGSTVEATPEERIADLGRSVAASDGTGRTAELAAAGAGIGHLGAVLVTLGGFEAATGDPRLGELTARLGAECSRVASRTPAVPGRVIDSAALPAAGRTEADAAGGALLHAIEDAAPTASHERRRELVAHTLAALRPMLATVERHDADLDLSPADRMTGAEAGWMLRAADELRGVVTGTAGAPGPNSGDQTARLTASRRTAQKSTAPLGTGPSSSTGRGGPSR